MEVTLPKRRFALARRTVRTLTPGLYGWALGNQTMRRAFGALKGRQSVSLGNDLSEKFTTIYETRAWEDDESVSGGGSNLYATESIRKALPYLFAKYGIRSVLDIPCGDFFWFKEMRLELDRYIGGDIVAPLIAEVAAKYTTPTRSFRVMDLTKDALPDCDLILVRDCFIHLSYDMINAAMRNILRSNIRYLLTTQYPRATNVDIESGSARPLNLQAAPFNFPTPWTAIDDFAKGTVPHQLALWELADLRK